MSRACDVILLNAATAFPNGGRPGDIYVGQAGAIDGAVAIVADDGTPVVIEATPYVPTNDNLTDLGTTAARFRTIYLGTSVSIGAAATGQAALITQPAVNQALVTAQAGAAGLLFAGGGIADVNGLQLSPGAAGGVVRLEAYGADAAVELVIAGKGTDPVTLGGAAGARVQLGGAATALVGLFGATPIVQPTAEADVVVTVSVAGGDTVSAAGVLAALNALENRVNSMLGKMRTTTGLGIFAG